MFKLGRPVVLPQILAARRDELETFYRALPVLLEEEEKGRFVVIRAQTVSEPWDTFRDAVQFGHATYGDREFLVQEIDPQMMYALAEVFGPLPPAEIAS